MNHELDYKSEREKRWGIAEEKEYPAIMEIRNKLAEVLGIEKKNIEPLRYDTIWFEKFDPKSCEWVKGAPDYCLKIKIDSEKFFYVEIKIKSVEFMKTINGGITKNGSKITNYGCSSYYLDIVPVYKNMNLFCTETGLSISNFWISFVNENLSEIRMINLYKIDYLIKNGWNGSRLCIFGEGYGQETYLIPKNATLDILDLTKELILKTTTETMLIPYASTK